jgi:hypothetical protein
MLLTPYARGLEPPVDPASYPIMDAKELGHLRYSLLIADQPIDDFSMIPLPDFYGQPGTGAAQKNMASSRYTLAFMTYFLALEQFHKLPAYKAGIQPRFDRLIQKMLQRKVWEYWADTSRGSPTFEPGYDQPYEQELDPVKEHNIMYSGHLAQMLLLYEKLYQDGKYGQPRAISFALTAHDTATYDTHSLAKLLYENFLNMPEHCHQCERNACFPVCNQHPVLALMLHDQLYGTRYFEDVGPLVLGWYDKYQLIDPVDHTVAGLLLLKQDKVVAKRSPKLGNKLDRLIGPLSQLGILGAYSSAVDGWNGLFMNAWAPEVVREHYPYQVANSVVRKSQSIAYTKRQGIYDQISAPFFAAMAAEMGDLQLRDQLLNWAEQQFGARFDAKGHYVYPSSIEMPLPPWPGFNFRGIPMTDKVAAMARANVPDGMRRLHRDPFPGASTVTPQVAKVSAELDVARAIYDGDEQALVVTVVPAPGAQGRGKIELAQLDVEKRWRLWIDGALVRSVEREKTVEIEVATDAPHDLVLAAESPDVGHSQRESRQRGELRGRGDLGQTH